MSETLPVQAVLWEGLRRTYARKAAIVRLCWPYAALLVVLSVWNSQEPSIGVTIVLWLLLLVTSVQAAVSCHRVFLLVPEDVAKTKAVRWGSPEWKFLVRSIVLAIFTAIIAIPASAILSGLSGLAGNFVLNHGMLWSILELLTLLPVYYFVARWSLVLPDAALDGRRDMSWAWGVTKGNGLQLFVLVGVLPFLVNLFSVLLFGLFTDTIFDGLPLALLDALLWIVTVPVEVCLLSLSYQWIIDYVVNEVQGE